ATLVKCIMGQIPFTGTLKIGHNVKIGYFAQNRARLVDEELTVFDTIDRVAVGDVRLKIRDILGAFMFGGEDIDKKVKVLSGGERSRLAMIKLLLEPVNFLILDEPTNHLDMRTKDVLKDAIRDFTGTVIVVSHDREFLDGLVEKVYEFSNGRVEENLGGIYDFIRRKNLSDLRQIERRNAEKPRKEEAPSEAHVSVKNSPSRDIQAERKLTYAEQKERDKMLRKARKNVEEAEEKVMAADEALSQLEAQLATGECSPELLSQYEKTQIDQQNAMSIWEIAQQELDDLKQKFGV
ncbi:MAG: ATP-binding cassette domain-containing protein, partial [Muribaculaceae bacterium]|nr:ATP-binding cassette domain-containing protein [Muribaculaceae bacterium]